MRESNSRSGCLRIIAFIVLVLFLLSIITTCVGGGRSSKTNLPSDDHASSEVTSEESVLRPDNGSLTSSEANSISTASAQSENQQLPESESSSAPESELDISAAAEKPQEAQGTKQHPREITGAEIVRVNVGDYIRVVGKGGVYRTGSNEGRIYVNDFFSNCGIKVNIYNGSKSYPVEADTADPGAFVDTFASHAPVDFHACTFTLMGRVSHQMKLEDPPYSVYGLELDDATVENVVWD